MSATTSGKKKSFWAPKHIAFIKGLPRTATSEEINLYFSNCGEIRSLVKQTDQNDAWTGGWFARFTTQEGLTNAISLSGENWTGN